MDVVVVVMFLKVPGDLWIKVQQQHLLPAFCVEIRNLHRQFVVRHDDHMVLHLKPGSSNLLLHRMGVHEVEALCKRSIQGFQKLVSQR